MEAGPHTKQADIATAKQADARVKKRMHVCFWAWLHQLAGRVCSGCSEITIIIALSSALAMGQTVNQVIERTFVCPLLYQGGAIIAATLTLGSCSMIISRQIYRAATQH
jgi:uncharacterized iron-regulated membrane protein